MHAISGAVRLAAGERSREERSRAPRFLPVKHRMQTTEQVPGGPRRAMRRQAAPGTFVAVCILLTLVLAATGCTKSRNTGTITSPDARDAALRQIATDFARSGDLPQAQAALDKLKLANPAQLIVSLAEADAGAGRAAGEVAPLARLAEALGARSPKLVAYLEPTAAPSPTLAPPTASPSSVPPSPTPAPSLTPTAVPPTATPLPPTASPTLEPQKPRVVAEGDVNLRTGPGRAYPIMGKLFAGKEADILARNASGDWWRIAWSGQGQAWVAGTVVKVLGTIDTVAIAKDIPAPPPTSTPAPRPTAQPTSPPKAAGPDFQVVSVRLWGVEENGGYFDGPSIHCGGRRQLRVFVLDAAGNPLNGVTVKAVYGNQEEEVTGSKGSGMAEFILGGGQDVFIIRDVDGRQVTSDYARGMSTQPEGISQDQLIAAGYCTDAASCAYHVTQSCRGHYSWDATFRRAY